MLKGRTTRLCNFKHSIILLLSFIISSCSGNFFDTDSKVVLKPINYSQILGWKNENFLNSIEAFAESCAFVRKKELRTEIKKSNGKIILDKGDKLLFDSLDNHLFDVCLLASSKQLNTKYERKIFFEDYFQPYQVINNNSAHFTGYYEPILNGSLTQYREFQYPIYGLPEDLISVDLGLSNPDSKNQKLVGRLEEGKVVPYFTRSEIEDGALANRGLEIIWLDSPIDLFFLHIQGSGRIILEDNKEIRVSFAGKYGHKYFPIGAELVRMGEIKKENISLQSITRWLKNHPKKVRKILNKNPSYIFFRIQDSVLGGPKGAQGSALFPRRSVAIDSNIFNYGYPFWISINDRGNRREKILETLVFGQDTGSAIKGPLRIDVFLGSGREAKIEAGTMNNLGQLFILLPRF